MAWRPSKRGSGAGGGAGGQSPPRGMTRVLAGMRIRKKLVFLHTCFSLLLAGVLALAMRPAILEVVRQAEQHEAETLLNLLMLERMRAPDQRDEVTRVMRARLGSSVEIRSGSARDLGIEPAAEGLVRGGSGGDRGPVVVDRLERREGTDAEGPPSPMAVAYDPDAGELVGVAVTLAGAREAVVRLYIIAMIALLAVYVLVALTLELFVLPQHVYGPISTILRADAALQEGRADEELVPEPAMPADELGEIMHSRNESIRSIRRHESELAAALARLEEVAGDLRRKNHLLEMARRNLADADRLASLGMMSAGIAHELNTPLAVLKGMVERLDAMLRAGSNGSGRAGGGGAIGPEESALMLRVVGRLEKLSESLLDFARARPHASLSVELRPLVEEAWMLVRLDREAREVEFVDEVPAGLTAWCDPDRLVQVMVNLLRNAVDALHAPDGGPAPGSPARAGAAGRGRLVVSGQPVERDGRLWAVVKVMDNGPGIAPETLARLFQPFVSTRLDARGTGLGLAVAEGIVREHGGVLLARNREGGGAEFEMVLPSGAEAAQSADREPAVSSGL